MNTFQLLKKQTLYALHATRRRIQEQSMLRSLFVLFFLVFFEVFLTNFFSDGLRLLDHLGDTATMIIRYLFSFFFLGMSVMLFISGLITAYATFYRSQEVPFLITSPITTDALISYKYAQSTILSSWAFYFIIIPFTLAFAWHENTSVMLPFWTLLFSVPFLVLCAALAAILVILCVRFFPQVKHFKRIMSGCGILLLFLGWFKLQETIRADRDAQLAISTLIPGFRIAKIPILPSYWMSEGVTALNHGDWFRGVMLFCVLLTTSAVFSLLVVELGRVFFYDGLQRVVSNASKQNIRSPFINLLQRLMKPLPQSYRAMMIKDIRTFFRDPIQWSQALIFFGLLAFYFMNLRAFNYHQLPEIWRTLITLLNIFSVSAVICSLAARFIYPQLSLEGQAFWILGLSPAGIKRILLSKYFLAVICTLFVSCSLIGLSSHMLKLDADMRIIAISLSVMIALSVCSLSTGLGATFLDLKQQNPSAIVSGFGGTLNLACSLAVLVATIFPFGFVIYSQSAGMLDSKMVERSLTLATVWSITVTVLATYIPMRMGYNSLKNRDF